MDFYPAKFSRCKRFLLTFSIFFVLLFLLFFGPKPVFSSQSVSSQNAAADGEICCSFDSHAVSADGLSGYANVQAAIDGALTGDAIILQRGVYEENLVVEKSLEIRSQNLDRRDVVFSAADPEQPVISILASKDNPVTVKLSGVSFQKSQGASSGPCLIISSYAKLEPDNVCIGCSRKPAAYAPSVTIGAYPEAVTPGLAGKDSATLQWQAAYTDYAVIKPDIGRVDAAGSIQVRPFATTRYTITAFGPGGASTATVEVYVFPGALSVKIDHPRQGEQLIDDVVHVAGTVNPPQASVFVDGVAAAVKDGKFEAKNVKLAPGANTIGVLAQHGADKAVAGVDVTFAAAVDLEPVGIKLLPFAEKSQSQKVSGRATVTVANKGRSRIFRPYRIILFEDADRSGGWEKTQDNLLGEETAAGGHGPGESINVSVNYAGRLLFKKNRLHVFVDVADEVKESNEKNNVLATGAAGCDLSACLLEVDESGCPDEASVSVRLGNSGAESIGVGVPIALFHGVPEEDGALAAIATTSRTLESGDYEDVTLRWSPPSPEAVDYNLRADDDGTGVGTLSEANKENNSLFFEMPVCSQPLPATNAISGRAVDATTGTFLSGVCLKLVEEKSGGPKKVVHQTTTDGRGGFVFAPCDPGVYTLTASLSGYTAEERAVELAPNSALTHQDIVLSPVLDVGQTRIVLTWGSSPADLEAHLTAPNPEGCRFHCFYWNPTIPSARLDLDDGDSYGPETITIFQTTPGTYRFYVHDFTNRSRAKDGSLSGSGAAVRVYTGSGKAAQVFYPPTGEGTVWHVFNLDGASGAITPIGKMTRQEHPGRIDFPQITSLPKTTAVYGQEYVYQVKAEDPDLDDLSYSLAAGPADMRLDPFTGMLRWTPSAGQGGRQNVEIRVKDGRCGQDVQNFQVHATYRPEVEFFVEPSSGFNPGGEILLTWQTSRADTAAIEPAIGTVPAKGSMSVSSPDEPVLFTITAENDAGRTQLTAPQPAVISHFSASCADFPGQVARLTWASDGAVECRIDEGVGPVPAGGSKLATPAKLPTTYTLYCSNAAGVVFKKTAVSRCAKDADLKAVVGCGWGPGEPVELSWQTSGVDECTITPDVGKVPSKGAIEVTPGEEPAKYTLSCNGASDVVEIKNPQFVRLEASTYSLFAGESAMLYWNSHCFEDLSLDQGVGEVSASGSLTVTPEKLPAAYTLTAINDHSVLTRSLTLEPQAPATAFSVSPAVIKRGEEATLSWSTRGADSCTIEPDVGQTALSGSVAVSPGQNTVYILKAVGPGGTSKRTAAVTYVPPAAEIYADPPILGKKGQTSTLTWVFSNADFCKIDQAIGEVNLGESVVVDPPQTTTYTITATGPGGKAEDQVTVTCPAPVVDIRVEPDTVVEGEPAALIWNAEHAETCSIDAAPGAVGCSGSIEVFPAETTTYTATASGRAGQTSAQAKVVVIHPPSIDVIEPGPGENRADEKVAIRWIDRDLDNDAVISLYYDINDAGWNGTLIAAGIKEDPDGDGDAYVWDVADTPEGVYWVYAIIDDGINGPAAAYAEGPVVVDHGGVDGIKLTATDGGVRDHFGSSVSVSGDYAVVGSAYEAGGGAVYLFQQEGSCWIEKCKKISEEPGADEKFGAAVSISADTVAVGAPAGNENKGAVYVFYRNGSDWSLQARLTVADGQAWDNFGASVCLFEGALAVGAPNHNEGSGAVYVFTRQGVDWGYPVKLSGGGGPQAGRFGAAVSICGNKLIVGAPFFDHGKGAAYVFARVGSEWTEQSRLTPPDAVGQGRFGYSASISGNYAVVGNYGSAETNVNGAVCFYMYDGLGWVEQAIIRAFDVGAGRSFGRSVGIYGDMAAVGAPKALNGAGAVYLFKRRQNQWFEPPVPSEGEVVAEIEGEEENPIEGEEIPGDASKSIDFYKLISYDGDAGDSFGCSLSLDDACIMAGARFDDDKGEDSGSAYIYPRLSADINAEPSLVYLGADGSGTTLSWTSRDADSVRIEPEIGQAPASGSLSIFPRQTTSYTITATGNAKSVSDSVTVTVIDSSIAPTVTISATPEKIVRGESATLSWSSTQAAKVSLDNGIGEAPREGSLLVSPAETTTYSATAANEAGTAVSSVTITVADPAPAPEVSLSVAPPEISAGQSATLTWTSAHAQNLIIKPDIGAVKASGTTSISPEQTTTYTITAEGHGGVATQSATVKLISAISIKIISPENGDSIEGPNVMVRGSFMNSTGNETGITVNGSPAMIFGNQFAANNVSLQDGWNNITVEAADVDGNIKRDEIEVYKVMTDGYIDLSSGAESGMDSLETTLSVNGPLNYLPSSITYDGPDAVTFLDSPNENGYPVNLVEEGFYFFTVEAVDESGKAHSDSTAILVMSAEDLDLLLKAKWADMKEALIAGDIAHALEFHHPRSRKRYSSIYNALESELPSLVAQMQKISLITYIDGTAKYRIRQNHEVNGQIVTISYYIYFSRGEDGLWVIERY